MSYRYDLGSPQYLAGAAKPQLANARLLRADVHGDVQLAIGSWLIVRIEDRKSASATVVGCGTPLNLTECLGDCGRLLV
jgi:hypothetical protein